jgi:hypothetical protein
MAKPPTQSKSGDVDARRDGRRDLLLALAAVWPMIEPIVVELLIS